jgi:Phospholipase_D-nuclease N-terminal
VAYASTQAAGAAVLGLGGFATLVLIVLLGLLALLWIVALFMLVMDSISIGAKILWFLFITLLAPIGIPAYFVLRSRRVEARPA